MSTSERGTASPFAPSVSGKGFSFFIAPLLLAFCSILLLSACQSTSEITEEHLVGLWRSNDGIYVRMEADGTLTAAGSLHELATNPQEKAIFRVEGDEFHWISDAASSPCKGVARYRIALGKQGELEFSVIEDDCESRKADLEGGPMRPVSE